MHYSKAHVRIITMRVEPSTAETFRCVHYNCMRRILIIYHSYINRGTHHVSNCLNLQLLKHQMMFYNCITSLHAEYTLRKPTFNADPQFDLQFKLSDHVIDQEHNAQITYSNILCTYHEVNI